MSPTGMRQMRRLSLCGTGVTGVGLARPAGMPRLSWLELVGTRVTDKGLVLLKGCPRLQWVKIHGTGITQAGVKGLRQALPDVKVANRGCQPTGGGGLHLQEPIMCETRSFLTLLLGIGLAAGAEKPPPRIRGADFPAVSRRAAFFEERMNAADAAVRKRVLLEVGYFFHVPDPEYVGFLRRMVRDPDPVLRGQAIHKLHDLWVPVAVRDLPQTFAGYHDGQVIDLEDRKTIPGLIEACRARSPEAGYAAYVLGLLKHKAAGPELRKLAANDNVFVRYAAARALIDCGDREGARPILEAITRSQLGHYAGGRNVSPDGKQPYYAAVACRALMELGPEGRRVGLERLIALAGHLERSADANDEANLPFVRQLLAAVTGRYFLSEAEAREWYGRRYAKPRLAAEKEDLRRLEGTWRCVALELGGEKIEGEAYRERYGPNPIVFSGHTVSVPLAKKAKIDCTFTIDPTRHPRQIDMTRISDGLKLYGIYELKGGRLKLYQSGGKRPAEFKTRTGTDDVLHVYEKVKE